MHFSKATRWNATIGAPSTTICQANLTELHERLREALRCLCEIRRALYGLGMIGRTVRYMAFCLTSEAAGLEGAGVNFRNLAVEIGKAVDVLDAETKAMKTAIDDGQDMMELLLKGPVDAK